MTREELEIVQSHRKDGETMSQTYERLVREGAFPINALATTETPDSAVIGSEEDFLEEEIVIPRWKLLQPTTRIEGATEGRFRNTVSGEEREKLENVVFLSRQYGRTLFEKDDYSGNRKCWSNDGYVPATGQILAKTGMAPQSSVCMVKKNGKKEIQCPFAMWRNEALEPDSNGKIPPLCKATIGFVGIDAEMMPFTILFHGAAIPVVKNFLSSIAFERQKASMQGEPLYLRDFRVNISLSLQINSRGKFYLPMIEKMGKVTDQEEREMLRGCYDALRKTSQQAVAVC